MNKRVLGSEYEQRICKYLEHNGYSVLEMNYRCRQGEVDIIAKDGDYIVFIEVKYRHATKKGYPEEAVDVRKQKRICQAAKYYMYSHGISEYTPVRFDVAGILDDNLRYIQNAFEWCL